MASERTKKNEPKGKVLAVLHPGRKQIREYLFVGLAPQVLPEKWEPVFRLEVRKRLRRAAYVALERN